MVDSDAKSKWLDGIEDANAQDFLKRLMDAPSDSGPGQLTSLYHVYFGDPTTLTPRFRQMRMEFFNSKQAREKELEFLGLNKDTSLEEVARHLKLKAQDAGLL